MYYILWLNVAPSTSDLISQPCTPTGATYLQGYYASNYRSSVLLYQNLVAGTTYTVVYSTSKTPATTEGYYSLLIMF